MYGLQNTDFDNSCMLSTLPVSAEKNTNEHFNCDLVSYQLNTLPTDSQAQAAVIQALIDLDSNSKDNTFTDMKIFSQKIQSILPENNFKKACNCAKSHCLKLYCECFARGQACNGCNCVNCMNNQMFDDERNKAIKLTLERNPLAFYPKIGSSERKHSKGCNCKRSNCLKNYCECYEAKISCSDLCRCQGCRNFDEFAHQNILQSVASKANIKNICDKQSFDYHSKPSVKTPLIQIPGNSSYKMQPFFNACITSEVIEVTCSCMLAQLYEAEQHNEPSTNKEYAVLSEFGRCLDHILDSVNKLRNFHNATAENQSNFFASESIPESLPIQVASQNTPCYLYTNSADVNVDPVVVPSSILEYSYKPDPLNSKKHFIAYDQHNVIFTAMNECVSSRPPTDTLEGSFDNLEDQKHPSCLLNTIKKKLIPEEKYAYSTNRTILDNYKLSSAVVNKISENSIHESIFTSPFNPRSPQNEFKIQTHAHSMFSVEQENEADIAAAVLRAENDADSSNNSLNYDPNGDNQIY